ncbi:hypothetical protein [Candidatus Uabimicrobium sp. HlEnr_7]|uniref:hypothetical protein n=1 Tax=Candidatus Uabimicrobium helgolandensis TaxID=3095367 RepID=UPI00355878CD
MKSKEKDPFQFFDDQSITPVKEKSNENIQKQREKFQELSQEASLTTEIKRELEDTRLRRNKIKQMCETNDIGLTAKIRMGIEGAQEDEEENIADKYSYGYEEDKNDSSRDSRSVWTNYISPTAQIKKNLAKKWESGEELGLTEKIARSLLVNKNEDDGKVTVETSVFWDLCILVSGVGATVGLAFAVISLL